jgi:hypothetical protein
MVDGLLSTARLVVNWLVYRSERSHYCSSEGSVIKPGLSKESLMTPSSLINQVLNTELPHTVPIPGLCVQERECMR